MMIIGVDPHKCSHTATVLDPVTHTELGSLRIEATPAGYQRMLAWATAWPDRRWAIENAEGLGHHLAQWLLARGEVVLDVPATATARVRELSRGGRRKNDRIDAAAAACVAAAQGDAQPVLAEDHVDALALLDHRRMTLSQNRTRAVNQLHRLLRELLAGGVPTSLTADKAAAAVRGLRPASTPERVRLQLCKELIADIRRLDKQLTDIETQAAELLDEHGTRLREIDGVGPVLAARILGRTGHVTRFASPGAYATYNGTAPVEIASADHQCHRLNRYGDRQLNSAIHNVAIVQLRMPNSAGRRYYDRRIAEGKTPRAALRCLKRHLSNRLWKTMTADEQHRHNKPIDQTAQAS
jgi:transposase